MVEIRVDADFTPGDVRGYIDEQTRRDHRQLATRLEARMRQKSGGNPIPVDTGRSIRNIVIQPVRRLFSFRVSVPIGYAQYWNNLRTYSSGRRNPNYQALQRSSRKFLPDAIAEVERNAS